MDFSNFIRPYLITIHQIETTEGRYEGGVWVPGAEERIPFKAAVVPLNDDMLQFGEAGTYTDNDRRVFTYRKLKDGDKLEIDGERYTVFGERDFSFYGRGLKIYIVRREGDASQ